MRSSIDEVTQSLIYAREAVEAAPLWYQFNPTRNRYGYEPYGWCKQGWERNGFRGYFHDVPNALRPFTADGDLTFWWHHGQSRQAMLDLFDQAIADPAGMGVPSRPHLWVDRPPSGAAKLTRNQVREIRIRLDNGGETQAQIGADFGVSQYCISFIKRGLSWGGVL